MRLIGRALYRLRQGLLAIISHFRAVDIGEAAEVLSPPLLALFMRMRRSEQHHCLRVMRMLRAQGHDNKDLLTAALLHDVGKSRCSFGLRERVMVVLANWLMPRRARRWGQFDGTEWQALRTWRRPFIVHQQHSTWSAEDMLAAGASPMAVALACRHDEELNGQPQNEEDRLLMLLQQADDRS